MDDAEELVEVIINNSKNGIITIQTVDGLVGMHLDDIVKQPAEGILYDLNRDKVTAVNWIKEGKESWINNFAVALVIEKLKEKLDKYEKGYFICPDCEYKVSPKEFLGGGKVYDEE